MAKQSGIVPLNGTLGNITFYKSKDGFLARDKGSLNANRIASDPAFQRTRENGAEFGRAGSAGKVLRTALRALLQNTADARLIARLTKEMMRAVQADHTNERGLRNVIGGIELLKGFEFNINSKLGTTLYAPFTGTIDRVTGNLSVNIPAFISSNMVAAPSGTTHFIIVSAGVEVDFVNGPYVASLSASDSMPWNATSSGDITLANAVTAASTQCLFLALGIEFFQQVNGTMYPLKNGAFNSLSLIEVSGS
ncbi:MAG: hypothetical protein ACJ749_09990 [Flavisolibacter sp.]